MPDTEELIEAFWDCDSCGTKRILGRYRTCPNCGQLRGANTKFYITEDSKKVTDDIKDKFGQSEDWICGYCGASNKSEDTTCCACGGDKESGKGYFESNQERCFENNQPHKPPTATQNPTEASSNTKSIFPGLIFGAIILFLILAAGFGTMILFMSKTYTATILNKAWMKEIKLEEYKTCHESGWSVPNGGRIERQAQEIRTYNKVVDYTETVPVSKSRQVPDGTEQVYVGTKDNGNGTMTKEYKTVTKYRTEYYTDYEQVTHYKKVPVYDTKYYYAIDRWVPAESAKTIGTYRDPEAFPTVELSDKLRESGRIESYYILLSYNDGKKVQNKIMDIDKIRYDKIDVNKEYIVTTQLGSIIDIAV